MVIYINDARSQQRGSDVNHFMFQSFDSFLILILNACLKIAEASHGLAEILNDHNLELALRNQFETRVSYRRRHVKPAFRKMAVNPPLSEPIADPQGALQHFARRAGRPELHNNCPAARLTDAQQGTSSLGALVEHGAAFGQVLRRQPMSHNLVD